jgi:hypothetical protein
MLSFSHDALHVYSRVYLRFFNLRKPKYNFSYPDEPVTMKLFTDQKKLLEGYAAELLINYSPPKKNYL